MGNKGSKTRPVKGKQDLNGDVPVDIKLGQHKLTLQQGGDWTITSDLSEAHAKYVRKLERQIEDLQARLHDGGGSGGATNKELQREKIRLLKENDELKFKNNVLLAMCTISEGDYLSLCKEAGLKPRANTHIRNKKSEQISFGKHGRKMEESQYELQVSCRSLFSSSLRSKQPDAIVKVFERKIDSRDDWVFVSSTEVQRGEKNPDFKAKTRLLEHDSKMLEYKIAVYDGSSNSSDPQNIGNAYVEFSTLQQKSGQEVELELEHTDHLLNKTLEENGSYVIASLFPL